NISTVVGKLYSPEDHRRDSGFTIFYMGINIGSFAATLLCGWLGETYGWSYGFGAAGIGMIIGLITFLYGQKHLHGHAEPSDPGVLQEKILGIIKREHFIYLAAILFTGVIWLLVQDEPIVHATQNAMLVVAIVGIVLYSMFHDSDTPALVGKIIGVTTMILGLTAVLFNNTQLFVDMAEMNEYLIYATLISLVIFIVYGFKVHNSPEYGRTVALMVLILSTVVFWALFEQSAGSMTLYADRVLDREIMGTEIKASMFGSLNAGFIMLLAIPFSLLWVWLDKKKLEPSTPVKFGLGIIQAGLGFGALVLGAQFPDEAGKVAMIWLVLAYLLNTTGELCLSPVGLSAVTRLSIPRVVGVSMGTWFLATALSETVATRIGKMAAVGPTAGETATAAEMLANYTELYQFLMWLGLGVGIFMIIISPLLRKAMHGVH
ncbi:MAG: peptide MFS transporter, partial [Enterobacterales bacterium]|nr:peptide MFS transporter [Enterobacterales bacterium]